MNIDDMKIKLGMRFKELRDSRDLTQEDLEQFGVSYRYFGRIERGAVNLTLKTLLKLCGIFEISLSELFSFMESDQTSEDREAVALQVARVLGGKNEKKIKKLRVFLDEIL